MKKAFTYVLTAIAILATCAESMGCAIALTDEPKAPKSMMD